MKFTPPIIAAICVGFLVISSLIVGVVLYAKGFFDGSKEPEKPADQKTTPDPPPKDELTLAIEKASPYLKDELIINALSTSNFEGQDFKEALKAWNGKLYKSNDAVELETALDVFLQAARVRLEKIKKYDEDGEDFKKAFADSKEFLDALADIASRLSVVAGYKQFVSINDPAEYFEKFDTDEMKQLARKELLYVQYLYEFESLNPDRDADSKQRTKGVSEKVKNFLER